MFKFVNHSEQDLGNLKKYLNSFIPYFKKQLPFEKSVKIVTISDKDNFKNDLGKTGEYLPQDFEIRVYCDGRHIKDIMRSISHELVHHHQNCLNKFSNTLETNLGYAQKDNDLRNLEKEAYLKGNIIFRDWEDKRKKEILEDLRTEKLNNLSEKLKSRLGLNINFNNI